MSITEIIKTGMDNGESYEVINKRLADAGFNLKMVARENTGWTEEEMKSGFIPADSETPDALHLADLMKRDVLNANKEMKVSCAEGIYKIAYDAEGYAVKAVRINV